MTGADRTRGFADFSYAAGSWNLQRRVVARLEATARGFDARYIVTSFTGEPRHLYEGVHCARGQAENLIKQHKVQLASDRTSCQSPLANQFRLVLHTAAYWLMLALRELTGRAVRAILRAGSAGLTPLPLDLLDRLPGTQLRALPLAFGRRRYRAGFVAGRSGANLEPFTVLEQAVRDAALGRNLGSPARACPAASTVRHGRGRQRPIVGQWV